MNRQTLEYFITLTETLNFAEAAKHQFVSQTRISRQCNSWKKNLALLIKHHKLSLSSSLVL